MTVSHPAPPIRLFQVFPPCLHACTRLRLPPITRGESTSRAIRIIEEGLKASLDPEVGEISANLAMLYDYMTRTLLQANLHSNADQYEEVTRLLKDLREAWQQIRPQVVNTKVYGS